MSVTLNQALQAEIRHEAAQTRKLLQIVPFEDPQWQPHPKSMKLSRLASHVAEIPAWTSRIVTAPEFDMSQSMFKPANAASADELLGVLDTSVATALDDLSKADDTFLTEKWTFRRGDHIILSLPRVAAIRTIAISHWIHHRGQLSVYLRILGKSIPGMYGPSGDDVFG